MPLVLVVTVLGAALSVLAFPPFGPGLLIVPGVTLFLAAIRLAPSRRHALSIGFLYGVVFFGGFMWWLAKLELLALILIPAMALFYAAYAWWLAGHNADRAGRWLALAVGGWAVMELIRYHFPVGGLEWGAVGYALSDNVVTRSPASVVGTAGLTVLVVLVAALLAQLITRKWGAATWAAVGVVLLLAGGLVMVEALRNVVSATEFSDVTIVQGSTPCPFEHCPPNERLRTYEQHLQLTQSLDLASLVVWPEGSTGSTNADPVLNDGIRDSISDEAIRLGARMVVGGDRIISDTEWINANVYFNSQGEIVGEYRKQHPVPFGEYIPLRPLFDWIPALDRVPRDMLRGDGPVLMGEVGSIISFEGGFSRYALETRRAGAEVIVVNTNTASYGVSPASDVWIGMTRMRAVENGVPIVHAAVTGKSTVIQPNGDLSPVTGLGTSEVLEDFYGRAHETPYMTIGNTVMYVAALAGLLTWAIPLVGSSAKKNEED